MSSLPITSLLTGLLALFLTGLSISVIARRRAAQVSLGDGGDRQLLNRIRAQANFTEYVPLALIAIGLAEYGGAPAWVIWSLGAMLVAGRLSHAAALLRGIGALRVLGMALTFLTLIFAAVALFLLALG